MTQIERYANSCIGLYHGSQHVKVDLAFIVLVFTQLHVLANAWNQIREHASVCVCVSVRLL
jgi:hypothetical protein